MKFQNVSLASWGYEEPEFFLTSTEIEDQLSDTYEKLKLPFGRLELQTGITRRGYWPKGTKSSEIATKAALKAIGNYPKEKIGLLVHASVCRDFLEPATACAVHANLGLSAHCMAFDLSNACLGVISATLMASQMIESGVIDSALIVSGENSGPLLLKTIEILKNDPTITRQTIKKYIASLTIGSAGVAWLITNSKESPSAARILGGVTQVDSSAVSLCQGSGNLEELVMETDSEALMLAGLKLARSTYDEYLSYFKAPQKVIAHQVGSTHDRGFKAALNIESIPDHLTYPTFGNTGSAALPLTFMKAMEKGVLVCGDQVAFTGIGSGLTSSMLSLEIL